jgi:cytoskeletal protein RodZ
MKKRWPIIVVVLVLLLVLFAHFQSRNNPSGNPPPQVANPIAKFYSPPNSKTVATVSSNSAPPLAAASKEIASRAASSNPPPASGASTNEEPVLPPLTVLDKARVVIHNYHAAFGQNPVGTNPEITAALMGKNPKQINFVADSGLRVNDKGEMVDAYGTPFFFHQISGQEMEIRSAGEDRAMWTYDDLVTK